MSGGNKFSKDQKSENEVLEELSRNFDAIRCKIQVYDNLISNFSLFSSMFEKIEDKISKLSDRLTIIDYDFSEMKKSANLKADQLGESLGKLSDKLSILESIVCRNREESSADIAHIAAVVDKIDERAKGYSLDKATKDEVTECKINLETLKADVLVNQSKQSLDIVSIKESQDAVKKSVDERLAEIKEHGKSIYSINSFIGKLEAKVRTQVQSQIEEVKGDIKKASKEIKQDILDAEQRILGTPNSSASIEARLINRFEMVSLDASNANLMSKNVESRMKILEKKIESLQLQLEKFELRI